MSCGELEIVGPIRVTEWLPRDGARRRGTQITPCRYEERIFGVENELGNRKQERL